MVNLKSRKPLRIVSLGLAVACSMFLTGAQSSCKREAHSSSAHVVHDDSGGGTVMYRTTVDEGEERIICTKKDGAVCVEKTRVTGPKHILFVRSGAVTEAKFVSEATFDDYRHFSGYP